jgi:hypothetical protein
MRLPLEWIDVQDCDAGEASRVARSLSWMGGGRVVGPRVDLDHAAGLSEGEALRPGRRPLPQRTRREDADADPIESRGGVTGDEGSLDVGSVERRKAQASHLRAVTIWIDGEHHRHQCAGGAEAPDAGKELWNRARAGGEQASPGQDHGDALSDPGQFGRQRLDGRPDVEEVGKPQSLGAAGCLAHAGGDRVHADEQAVGRPPRENEWKMAVTRAEVDPDPAPERGDGVLELLVGALEALAADDVHRRP